MALFGLSSGAQALSTSRGVAASAFRTRAGVVRCAEPEWSPQEDWALQDQVKAYSAGTGVDTATFWTVLTRRPGASLAYVLPMRPPARSCVLLRAPACCTYPRRRAACSPRPMHGMRTSPGRTVRTVTPQFLERARCECASIVGARPHRTRGTRRAVGGRWRHAGAAPALHPPLSHPSAPSAPAASSSPPVRCSRRGSGCTFFHNGERCSNSAGAGQPGSPGSCRVEDTAASAAQAGGARREASAPRGSKNNRDNAHAASEPLRHGRAGSKQRSPHIASGAEP